MKPEERVKLFIKRFGFDPETHMICPKFDYCNCNKCPLHKSFSKLKIEEGDVGKKCLLPKRLRKQIGLYLNLKNMGLTLREISSMKQSIQMKKEFSFTHRKAKKTTKRDISNPITNCKQLNLMGEIK